MWKGVLISLLASCALASAATERGPGPEPSFVQREMRTVKLGLVNADFGETGPEADPFALSGWRMETAPFSRPRHRLGQGREGGYSISLDAPEAGGEPSELYQDVVTQWRATGAAAISVSAWVWSNHSGGALLRLSDGKGKAVVSAFHSGHSRWEYLTVTFPIAQGPPLLRVSLLARKGTARFADVTALAAHDDRFDKALPDGCSPLRERVTFRRDGRVRIVIVGNSTVNGFVLADKRASIPYLLQLKLEAAFPGRFEVINFGICAWHLPPQIVSLDKAFNINLWCDGAVWCASGGGRFSHTTALQGHRNADANTPTIAELKPDVIVFAGMWNDVWRVLRYAETGIPPNPDEVNRNGDMPASIDYLRAVFEYADQPGPEKRAAAEQALQRALRPLPPSVVARLTFPDYASLRDSAEFQLLVDNATKKFGFLAGEFMRRARRHGEVWSLALPGRFRDSFEDAAKKLQMAGVLPAAKVEKFLMNGYVDSVAERIQGSELTRLSRELGVPSLDLGRAFHEQYGSLSPAEQFALGYFLENVEDNVHYTYRGNEWIADQMFSGFHAELARLASN